ncbi:hypothetical protein H6G76_05865 [Nostoc sp. FACHB-152]|uniref:hypothetical protein n=1 Tax=unclassified Nostoc TaxID=2593658 RepID=UPI001683D253|nr:MULTISPECIES: hypothetical protein [unclassified Nostoc]MBD2446700.1 hypothetical protein [Nostoc sp. FACHB-152]MBD2466548.1 hypothetical protein [Nostoc sp. FACHB-145]
MKSLLKGLILALVVSSPLAIVAPAVHAETTTTKANATKTHHKTAISDNHTKVKSGKIHHKKHLKHYKHRKYTAANLAHKSTTAANKAHK